MEETAGAEVEAEVEVGVGLSSRWVPASTPSTGQGACVAAAG